MNQRTDVSQVFNTFANLVKELEPFADVSILKIAFDQKGNVYLVGADFQEPLSNLATWRTVREELRQIIARRCPRVPPQTESEVHSTETP